MLIRIFHFKLALIYMYLINLYLTFNLQDRKNSIIEDTTISTADIFPLTQIKGWIGWMLETFAENIVWILFQWKRKMKII